MVYARPALLLRLPGPVLSDAPPLDVSLRGCLGYASASLLFVAVQLLLVLWRDPRHADLGRRLSYSARQSVVVFAVVLIRWSIFAAARHHHFAWLPPASSWSLRRVLETASARRARAGAASLARLADAMSARRAELAHVRISLRREVWAGWRSDEPGHLRSRPTRRPRWVLSLPLHVLEAAAVQFCADLFDGRPTKPLNRRHVRECLKIWVYEALGMTFMYRLQAHQPFNYYTTVILLYYHYST